jgi:hypothetical protein
MSSCQDSVIEQYDPHMLELLDEEEGMWVVDAPYTVLFSYTSITKIKRLYISPDSNDPEECDSLIDVMGIYNPAEYPEFPIRMNGKPLNFGYLGKGYLSQRRLNPPKEIFIENSIAAYGNEWYDVFYLVCGRLKGINLQDWFEKTNSCTKIGSNIATSMVKVAASRIFNEPEQSIVELLANSIDSYASLRGKPKVGRFGMGFFSFLYYLVGHPDRCLYIITTTFDKSIGTYTTVYLRIKEIGGNLKFSIRVIDTNTTITGTFIHLDTDNDRLDFEEIDAFTKFTRYLGKIDSIPIYDIFGKYVINSLELPGKEDNVIVFSVKSKGIKVTDRAEGIPFDVIINSLLIPSISTKGIKVSKDLIPYENYSNIDDIDLPFLTIMINRVAVVNIIIENWPRKAIQISLPSSTVLPVTRDDIIIDSVKKEFTDSLNVLLEISIKRKNLLYLENALNSYKMFTANRDNQQFVDLFINKMYEDMKGRVIINANDREVYDFIYPNYIIGSRTNPNTNEEILKSSGVVGETDIFANKRVVLLPANNTLKSPISGSTYSYLFIPYDIHSVKGWANSFPLTYKRDYLSPATEEVKILNEFLDSIPAPIQKYSEKLVHLATVIKNAYTVKLTSSISETIAVIIDSTMNTLSQIFINLGEEYFIICINKWMTMVDSIVQLESYAGGKRNITPKLHLFFDLNSRKLNNRRARSFPNYKRLLRELYDMCFAYNTNHNRKQYSNAMVYLRWYGQAFPIQSNIYFNVKILTDDFNSLEAILGHMALSNIDRAKVQKLETSQQFYDQIKIIYNKYLHGIEEFYPIFTSNWGFMQQYANPLKDLILWCEMFDVAGRIPRAMLELEISPKFTAKQLINYVFKHDKVDFSQLPYESKDLNLQILEISINAGTTKPFLEATLTELIQNSMDAIRLVNPPKKTVDIITKKIGKGMIAITIQDYVGMTLENIIAICIPFYSNKKASELVTGEMGTGFFNVYRESIYVMIDTVRDGEGSKFVQVPLRDPNGNVYDITTELKQEHTSRENGTAITFVVKCHEDVEELNIYSRVFSFVNEVIGLMDFEGVFFNDLEVKIEKRLIYRLDELECYYCEKDIKSYILTKGVPFYPLYEFFQDKTDLGISKIFLELFRNNIVVNIRHGFYTPVQSRTRLNISPENLDKLEDFLFNGLARALFEKVYLLTLKYPDQTKSQIERANMFDSNFLELVFKDWEFRGDLPNVIPSRLINQYTTEEDYAIIRGSWDGRSTLMNYILGYNQDLVKLPITLQYLIGKVSEFSNDRATLEIQLARTIREMDTYTVKGDDLVLMQKAKACLTWWLKTKYTVNTVPENVVKSRNLSKLTVEHSRIVDYAVKIAQNYVDIFVELGNNYTKMNPDVRYPLGIVVSGGNTPPGVGAYYIQSGKKLVLGAVLDDMDESVIEFQKNIDTYISNNGELRSNDMFQELFGYQEPCSTLVHEIEHARRHRKHDEVGSHDDVSIEVFGDSSKKYNYSALANVIYLKFVGDGLINKWLNRIKNIKI